MHPTATPGRRCSTPVCRSRPPACLRRPASIRAWWSRPRSTHCIASMTCSARPSWPTSSTRSRRPQLHPPGGRASWSCISCSPMFCIPRSLPTTCALRNVKRWRSVLPLEPPGWPDGSDRSTFSPRPAPSAPQTPGGRGQSSGSSSSHRAYAPVAGPGGAGSARWLSRARGNRVVRRTRRRPGAAAPSRGAADVRHRRWRSPPTTVPPRARTARRRSPLRVTSRA